MGDDATGGFNNYPCWITLICGEEGRIGKLVALVEGLKGAIGEEGKEKWSLTT